jgi:hypothetical protein
MPDGLSECVELIKDYLDQNEQDIDSGDCTPQADEQHMQSPRKGERAASHAKNEVAGMLSNSGMTENMSLIDFDDMNDLPTPLLRDSGKRALPTETELRLGRDMESRLNENSLSESFSEIEGSSINRPRHVQVGQGPMVYENFKSETDHQGNSERNPEDSTALTTMTSNE